MDPTARRRKTLARSRGCEPLHHSGLCTDPYTWKQYGHTRLFIGGWYLTLVPRQTKKKINTKAGWRLVKIGDSPQEFSPSLGPLHYYSHTVHPSHTHQNSFFPFPSVERDKNPTSHLRGVQFRLSLTVTHFPRTGCFHSTGNGAIFCIHLSKPRPPHALLAQRGLWEEVDDIWGLKMEQEERTKQGDGFVATSPCTPAINKQKHLMSYKYSDSVSSCCGLQRSSTIDLVSWQEVRGNNIS